MADSFQLESLFLNLIRNGLIHNDSKKPFVTIRPVNLGVEVEDNGVGFDERAFQKMLKPFERFDEERPGEGVGLSIANGIALNHGFRLTARSTVGEGSVITVSWPESEVTT